MTNRMFNKTFLITGVASVMLSVAAFALDLDQARSSGAVGEKMDGYAVALQNTPAINALVADVNAKRRQEYQRISKENGQPVDIIAKLASVQIISRLPAGSAYQTPDGVWKKR
jgi:uncharacterized protein